MVSLDWQTLLSYKSPKFLVKGYELAQALYGPCSRFAILEVRTLEGSGFERYPGTRYRVRDAETVSDAQVKAGVRPSVVGEFDTCAEALAFCDGISQ